MIARALLEEFERLSVDERIQLVQELWDRVAADPELLPPLTAAERSELDRRLAAYESDPTRAVPGEEVFRRLRKQGSGGDAG